MGSRSPSVLCCVLIGSALAAALPEPAHTAPGDLARDIELLRSHVKSDRWKAGAETIERIYLEYEGVPEVLDHADELEESLALCLFRSGAGRPQKEDLFGDAVRSFSPSSRRIVLEYPNGPSGGSWKGAVHEFSMLSYPLEGDVTLEFSAWVKLEDERTARPVSVLACYDREHGTGYVIRPGLYFEDYDRARPLGDRDVYFSQHTRVERLDGSSKVVELHRQEVPPPGTGSLLGVRVVRSGTSIRIWVDGRSRASVQDAKYRKGLVGVTAAAIDSLTVKGTIEQVHLDSLVASYYRDEFRKWKKTTWNRNEVIPEWVRERRVTVVSTAPVLLPSDAPGAPSKPLIHALTEWREGNRRPLLEELANDAVLPERTGNYLIALGDFATGRSASARERLTSLLEAEPTFAPAWLYRGLIRLGVRDIEGAASDLERAKEGARSFPDLHIGLASLAVFRGDLEGAAKHLSEARAAGAWSAAAEDFARWIGRAQRGPTWVRRFETRNRSAIVTTDHSKDLALQVGRLIDASLLSYTGEFPRTRRPTSPLRVQVFSNRAGFLQYALELGRNLENAAGAFIPRVGEMVLFVPEVAREDFFATVRHETFHAFLHGFLQDAPLRLDEGYAQRFEAAEEKDGSPVLARLSAQDLQTLLGSDVPRLTPLRDLLVMDRATFMENATLHYLESFALLEFLQEGGHKDYGTIPRDCLESLRAGLSLEEAFVRHWEGILPTLEPAFHAWLRARQRALSAPDAGDRPGGR